MYRDHALLRRLASPIRNERGATFVFVGLMLIALFSLFTIAIDVGVGLNARSEAQRTADAAALAGAGLFMRDESPAVIRPMAYDTANYFAGLNYVGRTQVDPAVDVVVEITEAQRLVEVWVQGRTPTLFARMFGVDILPVRAYAAARVINASGSDCVKPFALPDIWQDAEGDTNGNDVWDQGESWSYNPATDHYKRWSEVPDVSPPGVQTGYGASLRNGASNWLGEQYTNDQGRKMIIKAQTPQPGSGSDDIPIVIQPGLFLPFIINPDDGPGADQYRDDIINCDPTVVELGEDTEFDLKTGNMVGPTKQGIDALIDQDEDAEWDEATGTIINSSLGLRSPRVIKVALYDPMVMSERANAGQATVSFNNIGLFFIEGYENSTGSVIGRFIKYADGTATGGVGSLVKMLQLVK
jgi:hypothetical protein